MILQEIFSFISGFMRVNQKDLYLVFFRGGVTICMYPVPSMSLFAIKFVYHLPLYPGDVIFEQPFIEYYLKNVLVKTMFTLTVFNILLFEGRSVLGPTHRVPGSERVLGLKG